jgi:tRNA dimethylallyltransferase
MDELGLEYRYMALYLRGKLTKKEMLDKLNTEIWRYAKRQITWWRKDKRTKWIRMPK